MSTIEDEMDGPSNLRPRVNPLLLVPYTRAKNLTTMDCQQDYLEKLLVPFLSRTSTDITSPINKFKKYVYMCTCVSVCICTIILFARLKAPTPFHSAMSVIVKT